MRRFVELSHVLENGTGAYPGLPEPVIGAHLDHDASRSRYGGKAEFYLGRVEMVTNVGTYLDSPFHRFREGEDLAAVGLDRVAGLPGVVLDADVSKGRAISFSVDTATLSGRAVLVRTGMGPPLGDRCLQGKRPVSLRGSCGSADPGKGDACGGRFCQRGRHRRSLAPRPHGAPARGHPDRREPHEPRGSPGRGFSLFGRTVEDRPGRLLSGEGLCRDREMMMRSIGKENGR